MPQDTTEQSPADALASIRATRTIVADRMVLPWFYDALYAVGVGALVASQALPVRLSTVGILAAVGLLVVYATVWKRKVGVWVSGTTPRRARWVAISGGIIAAVLMIVSMVCAREFGLWQVPMVLGAIAMVGAFFVNRLWVRIYRREMEEGA